MEQQTYQAPQQMSNEKTGPSPMGSESNMKAHNHAGYGNKWLNGLFDCFSPIDTCCLGCWCPCFLYGKTYAREHGEGETSGCSWMCCAYYCSLHFYVHSCLQCITRGQQRERYNIEGGSFKDFMASLCCPCCSLIQEEKESIIRNTGIDPKTKVAYQPINQMNYSA